jgi:hypothetical protein
MKFSKQNSRRIQITAIFLSGICGTFPVAWAQVSGRVAGNVTDQSQAVSLALWSL